MKRKEQQADYFIGCRDLIHHVRTKDIPTRKLKLSATNILKQRRKQMRYIMFLILGASIAAAQNVYEIPFPEGKETENTIELSVANTSAVYINQVKVEDVDIPEGIEFREKAVTLTDIKAKEEQSAVFTFTVDKKAQLNKEQLISFAITDKSGQKWTKELKVTIAPPKTYELCQNYPNPCLPKCIFV